MFTAFSGSPLKPAAVLDPDSRGGTSSPTICERTHGARVAACARRCTVRVVWSEFAEKPFENLANVELKAMATDQVAEALLGYDAFANPSSRHKIWGYLGEKRPRGLVLTPSHWVGVTAPKPSHIGVQASTSLILQYKRCEYMVRPNAGQSHLWGGRPYYRFQVANLQQTILATLEANLGQSALVRYAAPAFHRYDQLWQHLKRGTGLANTGFVAPTQLQGHRYWTYDSAGSAGIANPPLELAFESFSELAGKLTEAAQASLKATVQRAARAMFDTAVAAATGELWENRPELDSADAEWEARQSRQLPARASDDQLGVRTFSTDLLVIPEPPSRLEVDTEALVALRQAVTAASILGVDWMPCMNQRPEPPNDRTQDSSQH